MPKLPITLILQDSWTKVKSNFWVITNAILLTALIFFATNLFSSYVKDGEVTLIVTAFIITALVESFMMFALMKFFLRIYNDQEVSVLGMFQKGKGFYKFFIIYYAINFATLAGLFLFIIPAVYVLLTYSFATYIYIEQGLSIQSSIAESARISKGNKNELLSFWLYIIVLNLFGAALFIVGLVVTLPVSFLAVIIVYKKLSESVLESTHEVSHKLPEVKQE